MGLRYFAIEELREMDGGRVAVAIDQAIQRAARDCEDRPGEKKARQVTIQLEFKPITSGDSATGQLHTEGLSMDVQVKDTTPTRKSKTYAFGLKSGGRPYYSTESVGNVQQTTFLDHEQEGNVNPEDN